MSATNWMKRACGLILPRAELAACKFRFGVTDSDSSCCYNPYPGLCPCPRDGVSAKYPMCQSTTCNPCCWEVEFQGVGNALCSDCYWLNYHKIKLASYYSGSPYYRVCAGVGSLDFLVSEAESIHKYLQCYSGEQYQAACFGWSIRRYNVSVYPIHDPYEGKTTLRLTLCYPDGNAPCDCGSGYGSAYWESDWFDDGTFDCSGGTTDVELSFVQSSTYSNTLCSIVNEELCSWAGSTATIRSVASEPGDCSMPAYTCKSCMGDMPRNASLEVEWVPGASWPNIRACWRSQFLSREGVYPLTEIDGCSLRSELFEVPCWYLDGDTCPGTAMRNVGVSFGGGYLSPSGDCYAQIVMDAGLKFHGFRNYGFRLCGGCEEILYRTISVNNPGLIVNDHINCPGFNGTSAVLDYTASCWISGTTYWIYPGYYNLTFRCS